MKKLASPATLSWAMAIALILCNALLIRQNLQLRALTRKLEAEQRVQVGDKFGLFTGAGLDGTAAQVRFDEPGRKRVVLFSSISCPFCKQQNPMWNQLIEKLDHEKYEVVEIFRDGESVNRVAAYLKANGFSDGASARIFLIGDEPLREVKLNSTPITLVVGANGAVEKVWYGLWNRSTTAEVNSFLNVSIQSD